MSENEQQPPQQPLDPDAHARVIVLVYGRLEGGRNFWCYSAVKPSKYQAFLDDKKDGTLNLFDFMPYGEIIISGEGHNPPDVVTRKVAEVYQTDPAKFFQPIDPEQEIERKMTALHEGLKKEE